MEDNIYYVYRHIRLDSNSPFYVGKGKGKRAYGKSSRNSHWRGIVNKAGFEVEIFLENLTEEQAFNKEIEFIQLYRDCGYILANQTNGGEGQSGRKHTEETKKKQSEVKKGKQKSADHKQKLSLSHTGKIITDEAKNRMSESQKQRYASGGVHPMQGRKMSPEQIETNRQQKLKWYADGNPHPMKGKKLSPERVESLRQLNSNRPSQQAKPIYSYFDDFIYPSFAQAEKALGISRAGIRKAIQNNRPVKGMRFSYLLPNIDSKGHTCSIQPTL